MRLTVNGVMRELPTGSTVADLARTLEVPAKGSAVAVDSTVVPRGAWQTRVLADGQQVEFVHAVQGG